jgi:bifunctional UDP-N-acetylglucosamine pyrophosphorylase/glucosamine-1-phosphate N-acetyltransferase
VAPVKIGKKAVIGAGSTITRDVPEKALGITRAKQKNFDNFFREGSKKRKRKTT